MQKSKSINYKINSNYFGYCNLMFITRQKITRKTKAGLTKITKIKKNFISMDKNI